MKNQELKRVKENWRCWTRLVAQCLDPKRRKNKLTESQYQSLYETLLTGCFNLQHIQTSPKARKFYAELIAVLKPWNSWSTLTEADLPTLHMVYRQALGIQRQLEGNSGRRTLLKIGLGFVVGSGGYLLIFSRTGGFRPMIPIYDALPVFVYRTRSWLSDLSSLEMLLGIGLMSVFLGVLMLWSVRAY